MSRLFTKTSGDVYLAHNCTVLGRVSMGEESSVWFGAVIRGDVESITIGRRVNVQDLVMIHCDSGVPNTIEADVTIGHSAIVHGKHVGRGSLIGMGAKLLGGTIIEEECLIGAGALLPPGMHVPARSVVMGVPAKIIRKVTEKDLEYMRWLPPHYAKLAARHAAGEFFVSPTAAAGDSRVHIGNQATKDGISIVNFAGGPVEPSPGVPHRTHHPDPPPEYQEMG